MKSKPIGTATPFLHRFTIHPRHQRGEQSPRRIDAPAVAPAWCWRIVVLGTLRKCNTVTHVHR